MTVKIVSKWQKGTNTCKLIRVCENGEAKYCFTGWNPLPIKGWFNSSYGVLNQWMVNNGWVHVPMIINETTIIGY